MKLKEYNPKAREAFGKTLVDIGTAIHKAVILLITVAPITIIFKSFWNKEQSEISISEILKLFSTPTYFVLVGFIIMAMWAGAKFRDDGLKHIHEAEELLSKKEK